MTRLLLVPLLALAFPTTGRSQIEQTTQGQPDHFGPGFTALSERRVDFQLQRPAHVGLFWVNADGRVDMFYPVRSRDRTLRRAGSHAISVTDIPSPIQAPVIAGAPVSGRAGQFTPTGSLLTGRPTATDSTISGYWVLFVTEAPLTALDVQGRLEPMSQQGGGPAVVDRLAAFLVEENLPWAIYVAPVVWR
jgi:hypothetical protein